VAVGARELASGRTRSMVVQPIEPSAALDLLRSGSHLLSIMAEEAKFQDAALQALASHKDELGRIGVRHLAVFGSRARRDARRDSDLDCLIDLVPPPAAEGNAGNHIAAARRELFVSGTLSAICGLDVSVIERKRLPPQLAARIADDLIEVF
jgi:uncharacterized protein